MDAIGLATASVGLAGGVVALVTASFQLRILLRQQKPARAAEDSSFASEAGAQDEKTPPLQLPNRLLNARLFVVLLLLGLSTAFFVPTAIRLEGMVRVSPNVNVLSPPDSSAVEHEMSVQIKTRALQEGEYVVVFVRPKPADPDQYYFAQEETMAIGDHRWGASPVFVGNPEDAPGMSFLICAVITQFPVEPASRMRVLPPGDTDCVTVTRQ